MKIAIIGAGQVAYMAADIISSDHNFELEGFVGTPEEKDKFQEKELYKLGKFLGDHSIIPHLHEAGVSGFIVGIGDNYLREKYYYECQQHNLFPINAVSPDSIIRHNVSLGKGVIVCPGVILCSGVIVGNNVIIEPGVICDIDSELSDHSDIRSGVIVSAKAKIGKNVYVGAKSYVGADIGKNNKVEIGQIISEKMEDKFREE